MLLDASQLAGKVAVLSQASALAARYRASDPYLGPHLGSYLGPYPGPVEAPLGLCGCPPHLSHVYVHAYQAAAAAAVADEEDEESEEGCLPRGPLQASQDF